MNIEKPLEDQSDFDTEAALAEISADLFGQGSDSDDSKGDPTDAGAEKAPAGLSADEKAPPQQPVEGEKPGEPAKADENSEAVQETGAPKTWSKEALADWATLPPRAQQEILKREEDFFRGISMYKEAATVGERYNEVVKPYAPILAAENIDPVQLFQSFAANHYLLSRGTEAQKLELAANMIQGYGIDFNKLIGFIGEQALEPVDPRVLALEKEIQQLKSGAQSRQQQEQQTVVAQLNTEIETFAKDPANPYFDEVVNDIVKLFETGQASTLKEAYDKAVYLNPTTRQKELDRLTAEKAQTIAAEEQARQTKLAKSTAADLSLDPKSRNGTVPIGSIDDTLAETMARIQGRA
jgi:hypothetical protein